MFVFGKGKDKEKQHCKNTKVKVHKRRPRKCSVREIKRAVQEEKQMQALKSSVLVERNKSEGERENEDTSKP